jgi:Flp pilus assembly protein TadD
LVRAFAVLLSEFFRLIPMAPIVTQPRPTARSSRRFQSLAVLLLSATLFACSPADSAGNAKDKKEATKTAATLAGNYLSSRHAQVEREMDKAIDYQLAALKTDPDNAELIDTVFTLLVMEGRLKEAKPFGAKVLDKNPKDLLAISVQVVESAKAKRFDEALERLDSLPPKQGLNTFIVPLVRAWILVGLKRHDDALDTLKKLSNRPGFKGLVASHTAIIHQMAGRVDDAVKDFEEALKARDDLPYSLVKLLGEIYERKGEKDKAKALYQKFIEQHPRSKLIDTNLARLEKGTTAPAFVYSATNGTADAFFDIASALRRQTSRDIGIAFAQLALNLDPKLTLAKVLLGNMYENESRLAAANAIYAKIDAKSPFSWSTQLRVAANLDRLDKVDEAIKRLRKLAEKHPKEPEPLINLGDILRGHERFAEAVTAYSDGIARMGKPQRHHWSIYYSRGIALERSNQWPKAEKDFLLALDLEVNQPYVLNYLGYSWVDKKMNLERAVKMIEKAVEQRPNDGYIVDSLGWAHYRTGNFESAARDLEKAVELRPEDPVINDHLGDALWKVGRRTEARFQWLRARSLKPEPAVLAEIEKKLRQGLTAEANGGAATETKSGSDG